MNKIQNTVMSNRENDLAVCLKQDATLFVMKVLCLELKQSII